MPIQIVCPHCGAKGNAPDSIAGQQVRCSKCKNAFTAQTPNPAAIQAPAPAAAGFAFDEGAAPLAVEDNGPGPIARNPLRSSGGFGSFLMFRSFAGRFLVIVFFWLGIAGILLQAGGAFLGAINAFQFSASAGLLLILVGLLTLILGPMMLRLFCEVMAVMFQVNERLGEIAELLRRERR